MLQTLTTGPVFPVTIDVTVAGKESTITLLSDGSFEGDTDVLEAYLKQATALDSQYALLIWLLLHVIKTV